MRTAIRHKVDQELFIDALVSRIVSGEMSAAEAEDTLRYCTSGNWLEVQDRFREALHHRGGEPVRVLH